MNIQERLTWLVQFADILETQANGLDASSAEPKSIAALRIAERTFNTFIDAFQRDIIEAEHMPVTAYLQEHGLDLNGWNYLKPRRDAIADKLSGLIDSDPKIAERYQQYCEGLRNHRTLGAML